MILRSTFFYFAVSLCLFIVLSCNQSGRSKKHSEKFKQALERNQQLSTTIQSVLSNISASDSIFYNFQDAEMVKEIYRLNEYLPVWSDTGKWKPIAIEFLSYLDTSVYDGLVKEDYHYDKVLKLKNHLDSIHPNLNDVSIWAKADLLFTEAFISVCEDLKQGRLHHDSLLQKNNVVQYLDFFDAQITAVEDGKKISEIFFSLQPSINGYRKLKSTLRKFISKMDTTHFILLNDRYKNGDLQDSIFFHDQLKYRLAQIHFLNIDSLQTIDSIALSIAIKKYQTAQQINADGKISSSLIKRLNITDDIKLKRILVTLDRYKNLPDSMESICIQANLPSYTLQFWNDDTIALTSKIICGKPLTPTPILNSKISEMIVFPTWTVPTSIIKKEMLPQLKKNAGYLAKKGLALYNNKGKKIDPASIDWNKYSKGIPYKIRQSSGEDNALGVIKFNFKNSFDVYLHDTNQRYLFQKNKRALSHGCVRVEKWKQLATLIAKNDSMKNILAKPVKYNADSIDTWVGRKQKHTINILHPVPLFITYLTCEERGGEILFHEDIYDDDLKMIKLYFSKN